MQQRSNVHSRFGFMRRRWGCLVGFLGLLVLVPAEAHPFQAEDTLYTPARLRAALLYGTSGEAPAMLNAQGPSRSIPLAFALSAAVPGLGQVYNRQWLKAGLSVALETALIAGYFVSRQRGLDEEVAYKAYAHAYWNPAKYARWLEDYVDWLPDVERVEIDVPQGIDFRQPDTWTEAERLAVRQLFVEIRAAEDLAYHPTTGATFSHNLPFFGEQQYYELVGKYFQFAPGWTDYPDWKTADGEVTAAIDPETKGPNNEKVNVQGRFWDYARDHAHANDLLRRASRLSSFLVISHLVSAIDAAVFAKLHNDRLSTQVQLGYGPTGRVQPVAKLTYTW